MTAGYDRRVLMWDPFTSRNVGQLNDVGDNSMAQAVVAVAVNDVHNQMVTATEDCKVKVWDIRTMRAIQSVADSELSWLTGVAFDVRRLCMVLSGTVGLRQAVTWPSAQAHHVCCALCRVALASMVASRDDRQHNHAVAASVCFGTAC